MKRRLGALRLILVRVDGARDGAEGGLHVLIGGGPGGDGIEPLAVSSGTREDTGQRFNPREAYRATPRTEYKSEAW